MKEDILVSVIIPTYRRAKMLERSVDSVLDQSYNNIEVIVVDDNNPDTEYRRETERLMARYSGDPRVRYIRHEKNRNGAAARNTGITAASGEIVAFLDDDDWYYPQKIEKQVRCLLEHPEFRAVYCGWLRDHETFVPAREGNLSYELLSGTQIIYTNAIMMWKRDAVACGGWDVSIRMHDEAVFLLHYFRQGGLICAVSEVLVEFDISDRSNTPSTSDSNEAQLTLYLDTCADMIEDCERRVKGSKRNIYSYRYRGAWLNHIKRGNLRSAAKLHWRMTKEMPLKFNADILRYTLFWCEREVKRRLRRGRRAG